MVKEFKFRGKTIEELKQMGMEELASIMPARARRHIKRGLTEQQKKLLEKVKKEKEGKHKKFIKTHCRDMIVLPEMVGTTISIYMGKSYINIEIVDDMIGHYLGEFARTRKEVTHKAPGVGATRSTKHVSVK